MKFLLWGTPCRGNSYGDARIKLEQMRRKIRAREEEEAMMKSSQCSTCGQKIQPLAPGTMVESNVFHDRKVGPVASSAVVRAYADKFRTFVGDRVAFIDLKSGALCFRDREDVKVVHGFVHIARPSVLVPDTECF